MADGKPKLGQRLVRAFFVGNLVGILMFIVFDLGMYVMNSIGGTTIMAPIDAGLFGWIAGISSGMGIELSKDME